MKIERSIVRRDANRPELAEGERTLLEMDPEQIRRAFAAGTRFLSQLERLLQPTPKRRPRRRSK